MNWIKAKAGIIPVSIGVLALLARWPGLGQYMTVDEEAWMLRSAQYWQAIRAMDPASTFVTTHPGAPLMWLAGAGEVVQETRLGVTVQPGNLQHFRKAAVLPVSLAAAGMIGIAAFMLTILGGAPVGWLAGIFLALDPYLAGATQIVHLDGLLALFMLNSWLAWMVWWQKQKWRWLVGAGIWFGLAAATKLILALWLVPMMMGWVVWKLWGKSGKINIMLRTLGTVIGVAGLVFWVAWPAAWVKADMSRSFTRDIGTAVTWEHVELDAGTDAIQPATFYMRTALGRSTPLVLFGWVAALIVIVRKQKHSQEMVWMYVYAIGFLVIMTWAAKKADRYALPALVVGPVLTGWVTAKITLARRKKTWQGFAIGVVVFLSVWTWANWRDSYLIAYNNSLLPEIRPLSQQGWGEGLEAAAAWLNAQTEAEQLTVASWYPQVLQTYFRGEVVSLAARENEHVDYIVTYRNMGGRGEDTLASQALAAMKDVVPVEVIKVHDVPYVWIYAK